MRILLLPLLSVLTWVLMPSLTDTGTPPSAEKINLALRRTADNLLRQSGDSTSRIPAVLQINAATWQIRLEQSFNYDNLPSTLQIALNLFGITQPYIVSVKSCDSKMTNLGFHKYDLHMGDSMVPCSGREMPKGCHYIEVTFEGAHEPKAGLPTIALLMLLPAVGIWWWVRRIRRAAPTTAPRHTAADTRDWITFGSSRLDTNGQILEINGETITLTFREAKLLRLLATHAGQLLEREQILQQVWADEGVMVGRSVDVFVSRLRKKLAADPAISIVAVHGVGYRLDIKTT